MLSGSSKVRASLNKPITKGDERELESKSTVRGRGGCIS